jgi:hypothetical protein
LPGCGVVPRDVNALADAVTGALACVEREALRARAEEYARQKIVPRVLEVYEQVAAQ